MTATEKRADLLKGPGDYEKRVRRIARIVRDRFAEWIPATQFVQSAIGGAISDEQHGKNQHAGVVRRAVHKAIDWLRRLQTQEKHQFAVGKWNGVMTTVGPEEEAVGNELREAVERAVAKLNDEEQHIWRLLQQDYAPSEIAGLVGKTAGAVRVQKTRILGKIREMLPLDYRRMETAVEP